MSKVSDWLGNFALYRYDASGWPQSVTVSGGPITIYQYDAAHNLRAIVSTGPDGLPVAGYRYTLDANGMTLVQKTEFELVAFDGKTATLKTKTEQTAPPQAISNPAMPPGVDLQLQKMTGTGSGTITLRLDGLVPTSEGSMESTAVMQGNLGGEIQQMTVTTSMKIAIAPGK